VWWWLKVNEEALLLMRIATLKQRLLGLYNSKEVDEWFDSPQAYLQNRAPRELLADNCGFLHVAGIINVILEGVYT